MDATQLGAVSRILAQRRLTRRQALAAGGAGIAAGLAATGLTASAQDALESYTPVALTLAELTTLKAAIDRLIPSDDLGPGAVEAGVFVYIDQTLAADNATALPLFQGGLAALDQAPGSGGFVGLAADEQDRLLAQAEANHLAGGPDGFFATLLEHTRRGMFGDPIHGGNRDFVGWDLIGYPGIKLVWTEEEQAIDAAVEPVHISVAQFGGTSS